jgi:4-hydroxy-tetrahydrodipicolinate reductase
VTSLVICGIRGRMGQALAQLVAGADDLQVSAGIDRDPAAGTEARELGCPRIEDAGRAAGVIREADVVIDFSAPDATHELLTGSADALAGRALVIGTTGLEAATERLLEEQAGRTAVLTAANFSIGVNLLVTLVEQTAAALDAGAWDIEIVEAHHGRKVDAPSGTALALADAASRGRGAKLDEVRRDGRSGRTGVRPPGEIGLHAVRGGGVIGDHAVMFIAARERIELSHHALDRSLFAEGALAAARWIAGRSPGRYTMAQVLGLHGGTRG